MTFPASPIVKGHPDLHDERFLPVSALTGLAFMLLGEPLLASLSNPLWFAFIFPWLFSVVLGSALCVVRRAERLA